jgi:hypothetical protein
VFLDCQLRVQTHSRSPVIFISQPKKHTLSFQKTQSAVCRVSFVIGSCELCCARLAFGFMHMDSILTSVLKMIGLGYLMRLGSASYDGLRCKKCDRYCPVGVALRRIFVSTITWQQLQRNCSTTYMAENSYMAKNNYMATIALQLIIAVASTMARAFLSRSDGGQATCNLSWRSVPYCNMWLRPQLAQMCISFMHVSLCTDLFDSTYRVYVPLMV